MKYTIVEKSREELDKEFKKDFPNSEDKLYFGYTSYVEHTLILNQELNEQEKIRTLKHELTHCWLHNTAHTYSEFGQEDVCEVVANINDFITNIVNQYIEYTTANTTNGSDVNGK